MLREAAAHAFVDDLASPVLGPVDRHHLEAVLRLRAGQLVTVADGRGRWRPCRWQAGGELLMEGDVVVDPPGAPGVTVAFALTKGPRPEWVVQKLTEVGVDRIVPFAAERSVVRWDAAAATRHVERWRRVAREAAMQSRRSRLPVIDDVAGFADVVASLGPNAAALAEPGGDVLRLDRPAVLVGPEGGWSYGERASELPRVGLGPGVLRAETAAVAAGVLLCALRAGVVGAAHP